MVSDKTKKQTVLDAIGAEIQHGVLKPGDRMLGIRELATRFGVSYAVINAVYNVLEKQKVIIRYPRSGTYINPALKFRHTRLVALLTDYGRQNIESYFETFLEAVSVADVLPIIQTLPHDRPNAWKESITRVLERNPDLILIDVEGRFFPLKQLRKLLKGCNYRFVNRWEWIEQKPERAVINDYVTAYAEALKYLKNHNHSKILVFGFHTEPQPFMKINLKKTAETVGLEFGKELIYSSRNGMNAAPEELAELYKKHHPTAVFALSDFLLMELRRYAAIHCPPLQALESVGIFNLNYSNYPGNEFASVPLDFAKVWKISLDPGNDQSVVTVPPLPISLKSVHGS